MSRAPEELLRQRGLVRYSARPDDLSLVRRLQDDGRVAIVCGEPQCLLSCELDGLFEGTEIPARHGISPAARDLNYAPQRVEGTDDKLVIVVHGCP